MSEPVDEIFSEATEQLPDSSKVERERSELISWIKQGNELSKHQTTRKILTESY